MSPPADTAGPSSVSPTWVRYLVMAWLCAAATIAYVHRNAISVAEEDIRDSLCLSLKEMGYAMSAFFLTYALLQLPSGWLGHVWGTRRALPLFAVLWSLTTAMTAFACNLPLLVATRLGMGAAQAGIFPCSANTIAHWFPATRRALPSGLLGSFMSVGGAAGALLTGVVLELIDWPLLFLLFALAGIAWAIGFFAWFRDWPQEHAAVNKAELALIGASAWEPGKPWQVASTEPTPWRAILTSPAMWWICGQQFFRAAGYIFFASWFPTFLKQTRGVSTLQSGFLTMLPLLGVVLGSFVGGAVSDWLLIRTGSRRVSRQGLALLAMVASAGFIVLSYPVADALWAVLVITAGSFTASLAAPCGYTITIDMGGNHVPTVFSTMNMAGNLGALLFPSVVPWLVAATGNWDLVLFVFAGMYASAAVCWLLLNPNGTIFDRARSARSSSTHATR